MTVLFFDGFDAGDTLLKWATTLAGAQDTAEPGRYAVGATFCAVGSGRVSKNITPSAQVICGFAFKLDSLASTVVLVSLYGDAGAQQHHVLQVTNTGVLQACRSATVLASTAAGAVSAGQWYYVELRGTIADVSGVFEVKLNGIQVLNYSGDTKNAGTATNFDMVALGGSTTMPTNCTYDDFYILNTSGSAPNNNFLGEVVVQTLTPNAAGAYSQFTPIGAGTNYQNVDELPYSTADYNVDATVGHKDSYGLSNLDAATGTVFAVQENMIASKTGIGAAGLRTFVRQGGTDYPDASAALTASPAWYGAIRETDPATAAAWTVSGVNALEVGAEVV